MTSAINPTPPGEFLYRETLPGGGMYSLVLNRHQSLRLTDPTGGANVSLLAYRQEERSDRLNLPDTLKAQYTAKLTRGHILMSDMGHALLSITADTCGWHDPLGGHGNRLLMESRHGTSSYQASQNAFHRNAHDNLLTELLKHGMGARDLTANVNFFSQVRVDENGRMDFVPDNSRPGDHVDLRAEMNVLVVLTACAHPMDPAPTYNPRPVQIDIFQSPPPTADDCCRNLRPENQRCLILTERLFGAAS